MSDKKKKLGGADLGSLFGGKNKRKPRSLPGAFGKKSKEKTEDEEAKKVAEDTDSAKKENHDAKAIEAKEAKQTTELNKKATVEKAKKAAQKKANEAKKAAEEEAEAKRLAEELAAKKAAELAAKKAAEEAEAKRLAEELAAKEAAELAAKEAAELAAKKAAEEAEAKRLAEEQAAAELAAKKAAEAEAKRLAELAEKKAAEEAERKRLAEEQAAKEAAELAAKKAAEAEAKRLAEELAAKEAVKKAAEEAEAERLATELAAKKAAEEAEAERLAKEAAELAAKKAAEEAEAKRLAEEQAAKEAAELAAKKAAEEAEAKRLAEELAAKEAVELAAKKAAEEAEAKRLAEEQAAKEAAELAAKRAAEEAEAKRLAEEQAAAELAAKKAAEAEAKRLAEELAAKEAAKLEAKKAAEAEAKRRAEELAAKKAAAALEAKRLAEELAAKQAAEEERLAAASRMEVRTATEKPLTLEPSNVELELTKPSNPQKVRSSFAEPSRGMVPSQGVSSESAGKPEGSEIQPAKVEARLDEKASESAVATTPTPTHLEPKEAILIEKQIPTKSLLVRPSTEELASFSPKTIPPVSAPVLNMRGVAELVGTQNVATFQKEAAFSIQPDMASTSTQPYAHLSSCVEVKEEVPSALSTPNVGASEPVVQTVAAQTANYTNLSTTLEEAPKSLDGSALSSFSGAFVAPTDAAILEQNPQATIQGWIEREVSSVSQHVPPTAELQKNPGEQRILTTGLQALHGASQNPGVAGPALGGNPSADKSGGVVTLERSVSMFPSPPQGALAFQREDSTLSPTIATQTFQGQMQQQAAPTPAFGTNLTNMMQVPAKEARTQATQQLNLNVQGYSATPSSSPAHGFVGVLPPALGQVPAPVEGQAARATPVPFVPQAQQELHSQFPQGVVAQGLAQQPGFHAAPSHAQPPLLTVQQRRSMLARNRQFGLLAPSALLNLMETVCVFWRQVTEERMTSKEMFIVGAVLAIEKKIEELRENGAPAVQMEPLEEQLAKLQEALRHLM